MAKIKVFKEILNDLKDYNDFLDSDKTVSSPIPVNEHKPNHSSSLYSKVGLHASHPFGNTSLSIEIHDLENYKKYSLSILSDKFKDRKSERINPYLSLAKQNHEVQFINWGVKESLKEILAE